MRLEHWFYKAPLYLRSLFCREQVEQELNEELRYHLERKVEEYIGQGMQPEEARYAAFRAMDGLEQRKEECRDMRRINGIDNLIQDLRFGLRMLAKTPGFTAATVLTLALGIGANTAIFSVVNTVLLQPLPYPDPDRIVQLMLSSPEWAPGQNVDSINEPEFIIWREETQAFKEVAAYDSGTGVNHTGNGPPEQIKAFHVSAGYFRLFGAPIEMGRTFSDEEDKPGPPRLVVLNNGFWHRRFGGERGIVGKTLVLGGEPCVVIGVLSAGFAQDPTAEIWLPLRADPNSTNIAHTLKAAARLQPGVTIEMARAQMKPANDQYLHKFPNLFQHGRVEGFTAEPLRETVTGDVRTALLMALGAVSFVLLIACANVANLLLARASVRRREMAIRAALGGSRRRIAVQVLIESVALAFAGGTLGLPLGYIGLHALLTINSGNIPRIGPHGSAVMLDWRVFAFTLLISMSTGILFGVLPAFNASHTELSTALNESSSRTGASPRQIKTRSALVVAEMALALILLAGAALLIRTLSALAAVDPGFNVHNVLTMEMSLNDPRFQTTAAVAEFVRDAERRVESLPGVAALAATYSLPLEHKFGGPFVFEGHPDDAYGADSCFVSQRYFEVFRIPLRRGRIFTDRDGSRAPAVVLINETMARGLSQYQWSRPLFWRNGNPLGERITFFKDLGPPFEDRTRQIIGVVGDVRDSALSREPRPMMYIPITQLTEATSTAIKGNEPLVWAIRTKTEPSSLSADIQRELRIASGGLPVAHIRDMNEVVVDSTAREHFNTVLLSIFAGVALILAVIGIYGVVAYAVQQRSKEIGIRIALGARPRDVRRMLVLEGMSLALAGVLIGALAALALTPLMKSLLYGVKPSDPGLFILIAAVLSAVALLATYIPAQRATRIDPVLALRWE